LFNRVRFEPQDNNNILCIVDFNPDLVFDNSFIIKSSQPSICIESKQLDKLDTANAKLIFTRFKNQLEAVKKKNYKVLILTYDFMLKKYFVGWKCWRVLSRIVTQLKPTLEDLKQADVIEDYKIYKHQERDKEGKLLPEIIKDKVFRIDFYLVKEKPVQAAQLKIKKVNKEDEVSKRDKAKRQAILKEDIKFQKYWIKLSIAKQAEIIAKVELYVKKNYTFASDSRLFCQAVYLELKKTMKS